MKTKLSLIAFAALLSLPLRADDAKPATPAEAKKLATVENVSPDQAEKLMAGSPRLIVIDVRTPDEFAEGHIAGAKNADLLGDDFEKMIAALPTDRPVIVHCAAGNRSAKAVAKIAALKLPVQIFHLKSGFNGWKAAGKPVAK